MSNTNLFYQLYSTSNNTVQSGYICSSAVDEADTSFDISGDKAIITDSNGNTLASLDLSQIHAAGITQYNSETRIIQPYSICLIQGEEYGIANGTYYFKLPEMLYEHIGYEKYTEIDFDIVYNNFSMNTIHIHEYVNGNESFIDAINRDFDEVGVKVSASIQSISNGEIIPKNDDYIVFLSQEPGYFFYIKNIKVTPVIATAENPDSPLVNDIDDIKQTIYNLIDRVLNDNSIDYQTDCDLYKWLLLNWESATSEEYMKLLYDLNVIIDQFTNDPGSYIKDMTKYTLYQSKPYNIDYGGNMYIVDPVGTYYFIYYAREYSLVDITNVKRYEYDESTKSYHQFSMGDYIQIYNGYYIPLIRCSQFDYEVIFQDDKYYVAEENGTYVNGNEFYDEPNPVMMHESDYLNHIIEYNLTDTPFDAKLIEKYGCASIYTMLQYMQQKLATFIYPNFWWLVEDEAKRIPIMKYPNGAMRGIVVIPEWPVTTDAYEYSTLWFTHVNDYITLYEKMHEHNNVYSKRVVGVVSNAILKSEYSESVGNGHLNTQFTTNGEVTKDLPDGYDDFNVHVSQCTTCKYFNDSDDKKQDEKHPCHFCQHCHGHNHNEHSYIGHDMYAKKNDVIGIYRFMQHINDNNLWNKLGYVYMNICKDDDPQNHIKNLIPSLLIYNPNNVPIKLKYIVFS